MHQRKLVVTNPARLCEARLCQFNAESAVVIISQGEYVKIETTIGAATLGRTYVLEHTLSLNRPT